MDGNFSSMTGNSPGCHPAHSRRYIRRVQVNKDEESGEIYKNANPLSVKESVWSVGGTDYSISFPVELPENTLFKKDLTPIKHLDYVKLIQENWVNAGNNEEDSAISHNVSVTVSVDDHEWDETRDYIWNNRNSFSGISLLPKSGDLIYNQAAYSEVLTPSEMIETYGNGVIFASGLIVDTVSVFGDMWVACDTVLGNGIKIYASEDDVDKFLLDNKISLPSDYLNLPYKDVVSLREAYKESLKILLIELGYSERIAEHLIQFDDTDMFRDEIKKYLDNKLFDTIPNLSAKRDIIRRIHKFSNKYFEGNLNLTLNSLKHVQLYHDWCSLTGNISKVDWTSVKWSKIENINVDTMAAAGCSGGACEITKI